MFLASLKFKVTFFPLSTYLGLKASKLRHAIRFRWTQSMLGSTTENQHDSVFEAGNVLMNVAFWYMKHSALISAKEDLKVKTECGESYKHFMILES